MKIRGKGKRLNLTFNNTEGTVKAYLNGGDQIELVAKKAASGSWYKTKGINTPSPKTEKP